MDTFLHYQATRLHALAYRQELGHAKDSAELSDIIAELQTLTPSLVDDYVMTKATIFSETLINALAPGGFLSLVSRRIKVSRENIITQALQLVCKNVCEDEPNLLSIMKGSTSEYLSVFNMLGLSVDKFFPTDLSMYNPLIAWAVYTHVIVKELSSMSEEQILVVARKTAKDIEDLFIPSTGFDFFSGEGSNVINAVMSALKEVILVGTTGTTGSTSLTDEDIAADADSEDDIHSEHISDDMENPANIFDRIIYFIASMAEDSDSLGVISPIVKLATRFSSDPELLQTLLQVTKYTPDAKRKYYDENYSGILDLPVGGEDSNYEYFLRLLEGMEYGDELSRRVKLTIQ